MQLSKSIGFFSTTLLSVALGVALTTLPTPVYAQSTPSASECAQYSDLLDYGIIGESGFNYGNNSEINGNDIDGNGNTPTPDGQVDTVDLDFPALSPATFPFSQTGGPDLTNATDIQPGSYGTITADKKAKKGQRKSFVSFAGGGTYYIEELIFDGKDSIAELGPGDYFIERLNLDNKSYIDLVPQDQVRLYVGEYLIGDNNIFVNSGGPASDMLVYLYDNAYINLGNFNEGGSSNTVINFNGLIYSPYPSTSVTLGNNNNYQGAILTPGEVNVGNNTTFNYSPELQDELASAVGCEPSSGGIHHLRIRHPQSIVSCYSAVVEVLACADANCSQLYPDAVSVDLSAGATGPTWQGGDVASSNGPNATLSFTSGSGVAGLQWVDGGTATLAANASSPTPSAATQCFTSSGSQATNCELDFNTAGLVVTAADGQSIIAAQHAGLDFTTTLRAIQTNTTTGACEARVSGNQNVEFAIECANPQNCQAGQTYTVNGTNVNLNNSGSALAYSSVAVNFDSNGNAVLNNNYSDVGLLQMHARLNLAPSSASGSINDPATNLQGTSLNDYVVKPHTLSVVALDDNDQLWSATGATGPGYVAAGEDFSMVIQSRNAAGNPTPNFGREISPVTVTADFASMAYPSPADAGSNASKLTLSQAFVPSSTITGAYQTDGARWFEAGTVNLRAALNNNDYLGGGDALQRPESAIGRFYPDHFALVTSSVTNSDGSFSYMDHAGIGIDAIVEARAVNGQRLRNYGSNYASTAVLQSVIRNTPADQASDDFSSRWQASLPSLWDTGQLVISLSDASLLKRSDEAPDGPFDDIEVGLQVLSELDNRDFKSSAKTLSTLAGDGVPLDGSLQLRYGRLTLDNSYGPETETLPVALRAEYWNGELFTTHGLDSSTPYAPGALSVVDYLDPITTSAGGSSGTLVDGNIGTSPLYWTAPTGSPSRGEFIFEFDAPSYLEYPWQDADGNTYTNPRAYGGFGLYRGNARKTTEKDLTQ
ncbi:hypothetical protein PSI9734_01003 [Pseudidiomarina piscicola]|uniref:DUF6701 domain-containing protein n=1 Tax=Pseudidiomarina piscicola TaxID=2614830 RepID=A0A6S6WNV8_9GAMM|nr:DUF6701 domain-containing protein [Pseudidiomarina piscicola]CAB0150564.1 hypothetical protein PSI9734_01003 [Pseudidiomarina piscicola]VZT40061.1 hypothetical protein PSI9734_01003 [Pseudomonas aeruginosa]